MLVGRGMRPHLEQSQLGQCGNIHLHSKGVLLCPGSQQHIVGCVVCFSMVPYNVVLVLRYTQVGNAWSHIGAHPVPVPLADSISLQFTPASKTNGYRCVAP